MDREQIAATLTGPLHGPFVGWSEYWDSSEYPFYLRPEYLGSIGKTDIWIEAERLVYGPRNLKRWVVWLKVLTGPSNVAKSYELWDELDDAPLHSGNWDRASLNTYLYPMLDRALARVKQWKKEGKLDKLRKKSKLPTKEGVCGRKK